MGLRFSADGPEFPGDLVNQILAGKVVFVCGAGVSLPQLPTFKGLVTGVYAELGMQPDAAEQGSIDAQRYEEALGALARRHAHPKRIYEAVATILAPPHPADLAHHLTLLRLSRNLDNRIALITTNFDTLFERAVEEAGAGRAAPLSFAGQSLPAPGSENFAGVIHLHGRLADPDLRLDSTDLVLTSAEYGDAYMRSGWAARFLFDLARCRTLVLVGYSAGDAPVRYFLNVLEADRTRFTDLRPVYALDAVGEGDGRAGHAWKALAVHPLAYRRQQTPQGDEDHSVLWLDLAALAELIERPKVNRRRQTAEILARPFAEASPSELDAATWLLQGRRDLWDVVLESVREPAWFDHLIARELWSKEDAVRVLTSWCSRAWTDRERLYAAIDWRRRYGVEFGKALEDCLSRQPDAPPVWIRVWRLLARDRSSQYTGISDTAHAIRALIRRGNFLDQDLRRAVRLLTPQLVVEKPWRGEGEDAAAEPTSVSDLVRRRLEVVDRGSLPELVAALTGLADRCERLIEIATDELKSTLELARDASLVREGWDATDYDVPSIEDHQQNRHRDGALYLARLLADLLPKLGQQDRSAARYWAERWRDLPNRLGQRLWLHALRTADLFSPDEVADAVMAMSKDDFWAIRRELVLLMAEKLSEASPLLVERIVERIASEAATLYTEKGGPEPDQTDWRPSARDSAAWLRLSALNRAGVLTPPGRRALEELKERHRYLDRDFEEQDLFRIWSGEVRWVAGDPAPIRAASPENRLQVARELTASTDPDAQEGWGAYCRSDPAGALASFGEAAPQIGDAPLWENLLAALSAPADNQDDAKKARLADLTERVFALFERASEAVLQRLVGPIADLLRTARVLGVRLGPGWWDRLWKAADAEEESEDWDDADAFFSRVINSGAGRLAEELLIAIDEQRKAGQQVSPEDEVRLRTLLRSESGAGRLARGSCAQNSGFVWSISPRDAERYFLPWLLLDDRYGAALRAVMLEYSEHGAGATAAFKYAVLKGAEESGAEAPAAEHVASRVLMPVLSSFLTQGRVDWGLSAEEARKTLQTAGNSIREGAAECMRAWVRGLECGPAAAWRTGVGPLFKAVWPPEREYLNSRLTEDLAATCVSAGNAFPEALETIKPYLRPFDADWASLHFIESSEVPEQFPRETLELLWTICGPESRGQMTDLGEVLDRIIGADERLETDRRLQWLEQRAVRYK